MSDAGVTVRAWGATRAEAFAHAAEAVLALIVPPAAVRTTETREARAQGQSPEALLVSWLNECLYVHEIEGFAVARVVVDTWRDDLMHGVLHGEPLDPARHRPGRAVKAATHGGATVRESDGRIEVQAVVVV